MSFEMFVLNMYVSWKLLFCYLDFESSSDTECSVKEMHYVFPMNQKCTEQECESPWFCH